MSIASKLGGPDSHRRAFIPYPHEGCILAVLLPTPCPAAARVLGSTGPRVVLPPPPQHALRAVLTALHSLPTAPHRLHMAPRSRRIPAEARTVRHRSRATREAHTGRHHRRATRGARTGPLPLKVAASTERPPLVTVPAAAAGTEPAAAAITEPAAPAAVAALMVNRLRRSTGVNLFACFLYPSVPSNAAKVYQRETGCLLTRA